MWSHMGVSTMPGPYAFTRMPYSAHCPRHERMSTRPSGGRHQRERTSFAAASVKPRTANFVAP